MRENIIFNTDLILLLIMKLKQAYFYAVYNKYLKLLSNHPFPEESADKTKYCESLYVVPFFAN